MSIAGGYFKALDAAGKLGMQTCQIFTKNNNQWRAKTITGEDVEAFGASQLRCKIDHTLSHSSYLINLASPDSTLWKKSIDAFVIELQRAEQLSIPYVVVHPGSFTSSSEEAGIRRICQALDEVHGQTRGLQVGCLLENTAGQGSNLGWQFEQLAEMIEGVQDPDRVGVCFDTCHAFAAGYPLDSQRAYRHTMRCIRATFGIDRIKAFHLNDSKRELGSRVDRHEHIGKGHLGLEPFRRLLNDGRFRRVPMYLETPKGTYRRKSWDKRNLEALQALIESASA